MFNLRRIFAVGLTSVIAASTLVSASAQSTTKNLSSNFTLVNLVNGQNGGQIAYVLPDGSQWRAPETITLNGLGDQLIRRQYDDPDLDPGSGSVVVSTDGPVGAVVQIQARAPQVPTFGAYVGVSEGAPEANVPLVMRNLNTASGLGNSQVIVQNASGAQIDVEIEFVPGAGGLASFTKTINDLNPNAAAEVDLEDDPDVSAALADGWFGSAVVRSTTPGGEVAVVSNLFSGDHGMQTFNAFTTAKTQWGVPLFASKLANSLSTPVAVQNAGTSAIAENAVTLSCTKNPQAPAELQDTLIFRNSTAIAPGGAFFFNPVGNAAYPDGWFGACTVTSGSSPTAVFVQLRTVNGNRAGAHEGIPLDSTATSTVIPLYAKRLANGFASAITIQNLSASQANVTLNYIPAAGQTGCSAHTLNRTISGNGSLIQNLRILDGPGAVPEVESNCFGALTVTSNQPVDAFVQLDLLDDILDPDPGGDPFQAHNAFTIASTN